jgi:DNA-binding transcriptional LysR family regulator
MAEAQLGESKDRPKGQLKVTATQAFGSAWLTPSMVEFIELYPDVEVDLVLEDRELDLSMREADVAIRMQPPRQPELIQRHLLTMHTYVYAAPNYLKRTAFRRRRRISTAIASSCSARTSVRRCRRSTGLMRSGVRKDRPRRAVLKVNSVYAIRRAVQSGMGLASLPEFMATDSQNLVRVLPELQGPRIDAYFVYPEELRNSKRIQVFRDFLLRKVAEGKMQG